MKNVAGFLDVSNLLDGFDKLFCKTCSSFDNCKYVSLITTFLAMHSLDEIILSDLDY